jgi:hypothetical protein
MEPLFPRDLSKPFAYLIEAASHKEALAKFKAGEGERHVRHRRLTAQEIEGRERLDAIEFLRELGLWARAMRPDGSRLASSSCRSYCGRRSQRAGPAL